MIKTIEKQIDNSFLQLSDLAKKAILKECLHCYVIRVSKIVAQQDTLFASFEVVCKNNKLCKHNSMPRS